MKTIKVEQNDFNESFSTGTSNFKEKNKSLNLKIIKLHNYLNLSFNNFFNN